MNIWKDRKSGQYQVRFTVDCLPNECDACRIGRRHRKHSKRRQESLKTTVKGQAEELAWEVIRESKARANGTYIPTLGELRQDWLQIHATEVSIGHWRNVNSWDSQGLDEYRIDRLTKEVVELARGKFRAGKGRLDEMRSDASVAGWMRTINLLMNWAKSRRTITELPYDIAIQKPQKKPKKILPLALERAWMECVGRHSRNPQVLTATYLMGGLGIRESEANGSRWEFIDWEAHTYIPGRLIGHQFRSKGKKAVPVDIPDWLYDYLLKLRGDAPRLGLIIPWKTLDDGTEVPHPPTFTRAAMRAANLEMGTPGITAHRLRGTFITHLLRRGVPAKEVQEIVGHAEESTTNGYYEVSSEVRKKAVADLAKEMGFENIGG